MGAVIYAFILSLLAILSLAGPAASQLNPHTAAAGCVGSDADITSPEAREATCLLELSERASRKGNVLSLRLDNATIKTFRSNPDACKNDLADKCVTFRLVGYHAAAGRYIVLVQGYEGYECRLVGARDGKATTFLGCPHFAPDSSTFFVTGYDGSYDNWIGIGSVASNPPALVWEQGPDVSHDWHFLHWIDNDQVALRDSAQTASCPDGNCEAVLRRTADGWVLQALPSRSSPKRGNTIR